MELFNKKPHIDPTKHSFIQNYASWDHRIRAAILLSIAFHALLLLLDTSSNNISLPSHKPMKVIGINSQIWSEEKLSKAWVKNQQSQSELITTNSEFRLSIDQLAITETFEKPAYVNQNPSDPTDAEESQIPIKGLSVGSSAFTGFGGGRKRPFGFVQTKSESSSLNTSGDLQDVIVRRQMIQAFLEELKNDLNQIIPLEAGQMCQLQTAVVCQKNNDILEKYLLMKVSSIQQLVAGKMVIIKSGDGQWRIEISN